uniref:Uncharacterized protein n=1 Tax=Anguilla anguilla TaxID=7936 RepID=A0A0E9PQK9_ANGAN
MLSVGQNAQSTHTHTHSLPFILGPASTATLYR